MTENMQLPDELKNDLQIKVCDIKLDLDDKTKFTKLEGTSAAKSQICSFIQHAPALAAINASSNLYTVTFPAGVPHTLGVLSNGSGYFSAIRDPATGKFVGSAALNPINPVYSIIGSALTVMSVITAQYYLTEINSKLNKIQLGVDRILEFLYGDKRAELISEVTFAKYAFENFGSIMAHPEQRIATIAGLQNTRKIAMKDIEFYMNDLDAFTATDISKTISESAKKAVQLTECLDLSAQLYVMSGVMESYYSQNTDESYISYVEKEMSDYVDKFEKHVLTDYAKIVNPILNSKNEGIGYEKKKIGKTMDELQNGGDSPLQKSLKEALHASEKKAEFYIRDNGDVYVRADS